MWPWAIDAERPSSWQVRGILWRKSASQADILQDDVGIAFAPQGALHALSLLHSTGARSDLVHAMQPKYHTGGPRQRLWGRSKCSALRISVFQRVWHHHRLCRRVLRFKQNALFNRQLTRIARQHASIQHKCLSAVPRSHFSRAEVFNNPPDVLVSNWFR